MVKHTNMNVMNAQQSSLYRSTRLYFCVSLIVYMLLRIALASMTPTNTPMVSIVLAITVVPAQCIPHRPLLWLFGSGKNVWVSQTSDRLGSPILSLRPCVACWCLISYKSLVVCRITIPFPCLCMVTFVPLFCFILSDRGAKNYCYINIGGMWLSTESGPVPWVLELVFL